MELLQKFAVVEIQTDHRISETDKDYCELHQKAYEAAITSFQELAFFWEDMNKVQQELLGDSKSPFYHNYLASHNGPSISQISINNHIEALHRDFIMNLTHYFNSTYHVSVESSEISEVLLPQKPEGRWQDNYVEICKAYQTQMQSLVVRYQAVVDQLILRLNGRSLRSSLSASIWATSVKGGDDMKYSHHPAPSDAESCKMLNEKVLYLIDSGTAAQAGITGEDIYNAYTGDGGLHGLERKDFDNYHSYSEAKKELENGQFFTPPNLCQLVAAAG